jgi:hypothetical protein
MSLDSKRFQECQRVHVERETRGAEQVVRISVERHDAALGWYTAGSLSIPVCQLPALEQALHELSATERFSCAETCGRKIIPFPLMAREPLVPAAESVN